MFSANIGRFQVRFAQSKADVAAAQALRFRCFRQGRTTPGLDQDEFDSRCQHVLISKLGSTTPVCCFRLLKLETAKDIATSYAAQFYDLANFQKNAAPAVEMGRFCMLPGLADPDVLRIAWGVLARYIDENKVKTLFGCSSFAGTNAGNYDQAFALLNRKYLGDAHLRPQQKAPEVIAFGPTQERFDLRRATKNLPPLLRSYLAVGGWVSDHAVVDRDLDTMHVFTGLAIDAIPPKRAEMLRAVLDNPAAEQPT